jgi:hypothetical protein
MTLTNAMNRISSIQFVIRFETWGFPHVLLPLPGRADGLVVYGPSGLRTKRWAMLAGVMMLVGSLLLVRRTAAEDIGEHA